MVLGPKDLKLIGRISPKPHITCPFLWTHIKKSEQGILKRGRCYKVRISGFRLYLNLPGCRHQS